MKSLLKWLGYFYLGTTLLSVVAGFGFTRKNAEDIRNYQNPGTEFHESDPDLERGGYRLRRLEGGIARVGNTFVLHVPGLMTSGDDLVLRFPTVPQSRNGAELEASNGKGPSDAASGSERPASIRLYSGAFDDTALLENQMDNRDGYPNRLLLGVYWDLNTHGNQWVRYHLGYQYSPDQRYTTVWTEARLPWRKRTQARLSTFYLRYLYTLPLDIATSPLQLLARLVAPKWSA